MREIHGLDEPPVVLRALDPETQTPGFWDRNHGHIMEQAAGRLAARRARAVSMGDVLMSWSRLLIPSVAMAAGVLAFSLLSSVSGDDPAQLFGVEDMLHEAWSQGSTLPVVDVSVPQWEEAFVFAVERGPVERRR
jgi:hypothetical protein